ncbi:hypothetical protein JVT61DRAFT_12439 [Boletus reticuloceps]|uniref:Uncharacterized protein n=1 Tax=Boletus reticuloceps TaxID=495285 RepID=A0A8I2YE46_9AGAM|nr:hypothetical protein JVT61DRAFT_12439 [Boletus reticuloceps]
MDGQNRPDIIDNLAPGYPDDRDQNAAQLSLEQFCHKANQLYVALQNSSDEEEAEHAKRFTQFVLAGRTRNRHGVPGHITVNACQGLVDIDEFKVTRDYDSLIGISKDLPFTTHLELMPVPPYKLTLSSPNHLNGTAIENNVQQLVPMHTIPNFAFAKVTNRSVVRVFLPRMYRLRETRAIPSTDMELIYDQCLRPLIQHHLPNMYTHWPASYASALTLYRDSRGQIHPGSLDIPAELLFTFGPEYLTRLAELKPYFRDAYFVHEFRGWKGITVHDPYSGADRQAALDKMLHFLDWPRIQESDWHVDVGFEIGVPGSVVTWRHTGHRFLLAHCLPTLHEGDIEVLLNRKTEMDHQMHLKDLTGFRCQPGRKGSRDKVSYIQAYTTEKTMSYQLHNGLFKPFDPVIALTNKNLEATAKKIEQMSKVLFACSGDHVANEDDGSSDREDLDQTPQDGTARIEVRVQLGEALTALISIPDPVIDHSIVAIPSRYWWYFKWYRLASINTVLRNLAASTARNRQSDSVVGLAGLVIWILNGLYRRPDPRFNSLAAEACQHIPVDYDQQDPDIEDLRPLMYDAGLYFVCDIVADSTLTLRLPFHKAMSDDAIRRAFGRDLLEIRSMIGVAIPDVQRRTGVPDRTANRSSRVTLRVDDIRPAERAVPQIDDRLLHNIQRRHPAVARGPDVEHFRTHGGGTRDGQMLRAQPAGSDDFIRTIKTLLEQMFHDILQESPNQRSALGRAWTNIPSHRRPEQATEQLYKSFAVPFIAVQYTFCDEKEWQKRFDHFFPLQRPDRRPQNFPKCRYYQDWMVLIDTLTPSSLQRVRATLQTEFDKLIWVPFTGADRMWETRTKEKSRGWLHLPQTKKWEGPHIAFSPHARGLDPHGVPSLRPAPDDPAADGGQEQGGDGDEGEDMDDLRAALNRHLFIRPRPRLNAQSESQGRQQQAASYAGASLRHQQQRQNPDAAQISGNNRVQRQNGLQGLLREEEEESSDDDLYG